MTHAPTVAETVRERVTRVSQAGAHLRGMPLQRIAEAIARTAHRLSDPNHEHAETVRAELTRSSALSRAMVDWALSTTLSPLSPHDLAVCAPLDGRETQQNPPHLTAIFLAGNVFTAAFAPTTLSLLARSPTILKASSRDDAFPRLFSAALREEDTAVGACLETITFKGGLEDAEDALIAPADTVVVYGSDQTLRTVRNRVPVTARFIGRGHGLGAAYVSKAPDDLGSLLDRLALDVAAYDQRGCLSPHAVFVARGGPLSGRQVAQQLADALGKLAKSLPRGPLPAEAGAHQVQWRAVGALRGDLFEGDGFAVTFEGSEALRVSPGYRNVAVLEVDDEADACARLAPLGTHLKALGIEGSFETRRRIAAALAPPLAPRVCRIGSMQRPRLGDPADGMESTAGVARWFSVT